MPIRFLIVVGGTGKGLLGQTRALGFKQEWQLDVATERKPLENAEFTKFVALDQHVVSVPVTTGFQPQLADDTQSITGEMCQQPC